MRKGEKGREGSGTGLPGEAGVWCRAGSGLCGQLSLLLRVSVRGCYAAGAARLLTESLLHKDNDWPRQRLALDYTSADTQLSEVRRQV